MRVRLSGKVSLGLLWCALIIAVAAPTAAADALTALRSENVWIQSAPILAEPHLNQIAMAPSSTEAKVKPLEPRNISLDFHAADITDVLKALSVQSGTNIVTGTDVKGQVTVSLNKVSLHEALDMVTKLSGFRYAAVGRDTYIVGSTPGVSGVLGSDESDTTTEAVTINYANPDQIGQLLAANMPNLKYVPTGAKADQPGPKVVMLTGPKSVVESAKAMIDQVELSLSQESQNKVVEVYRLKYANAKDVTAMLSTVLPRLAVSVGPANGFDQRPPSGITFVETTGGKGGSDDSQIKEEPMTIVLAGNAEDVYKAKELIGKVDVKPRQVLIEIKVTDITVSAEKRLGITWSWDSISFSEGTDTDGGGNNKWNRTPMNVEGQLSAMLEDDNANLLANPTVAAIEGKPAVIFIGDEVKYIIKTEQTLTGSDITTETANVGVTLRVIARPDDDGYITMALHPEVSTITGWLSVGTGSVPQISRRYTDHVIRVKDGDTIVIGGLIKDNELNNLTKVPLLGDLPFFGNLFKHREKTKEHSDIAIFLKATLLSD
ncbi:MAG: secretin N-terminal domain-containing protein [Armatimonadota bacterium]